MMDLNYFDDIKNFEKEVDLLINIISIFLIEKLNFL